MAKLFDKIKKVFNNRNIMVLVTPIIMLILLFSATAAWYVLSGETKINLFGGKISQWDLVVSDTPGGEPLTDNDTLEINFTEFTNVTDNVMAPGTYGTVDFYIRTTTDVVTDYLVYIDKSALEFNAYSSTAADDETIKAEIKANTEMLHNHIRFYTDEALTQEVTMTQAFKGSIQPNSEVKVTLYWHWVYDGTDYVPAGLTDEADIEQFLWNWDMDDCFISDNRDKLAGNIKVYINAAQQVPQEQ